MKKKEKLILSAILLAVGTVLNLFFTAALHGLMSRQYITLTWIRSALSVSVRAVYGAPAVSFVPVL